MAALGVGAVSLAVALGVCLTTPADSYWINDCGSKALLARQLAASRYAALDFDYPAREVDPEARAFPIQPPYAVARGDGFVSTFPPAYAALAAPWAALLGPWALRLPAALGAAACAALLVLWLQPVVGSRPAAGAGAFLALASPLLFYGVTVWEHSLTVAAVLGASLLASRPGPAAWLAAGALVGVACWLREELLLFGAALACACALSQRRGAAALWLAAGAGPPLAALLAWNQRVFGTPLGVHVAANAQLEAVGTAAPQPWRVVASLLAGLGAGAVEAAVLGAAAALALLGGAWLARRDRAAMAVALATALGLGLWAYGTLRIATAARPLSALVHYNGLLVQLPCAALVGVGLHALFARRDAAPLRVGIGAGLGFAAAVVAIGASGLGGQGLPTGFGVHWGPRILLPAVPAAVALALLALVAVGERGGPRRVLAGSAAVALVAAGLVSSAVAVGLLAEQKADARRFAEQLRRLEPRYTVTTQPLLAQHLAALWREKPMLLARDPRSLARVVRGLRARGVADFLVVGPPDGARITWIDGLACAPASRYRGARLHYFDLDVQRCRAR